MDHAGAQVGGAQRKELPVGVERGRLVGAVGESPRGEDEVRVRDEQYAECGQHQARQRTQVGQGQTRKAGGNRADDRDAVPAVQVEGDRGRRGEDHREQRARQEREEAGDGEEEQKYGGGQDHRGRVGVRQIPEEGPELREERRAVRVHTGELGQLVDGHDQRHAREIADQDRAGEQIREEAQPDRPGHQAQQPDRDGEGGRERRVAPGITRGQRADHRGRHQGRRGLRADRQQAGGTEERVQGQRRKDRPEPGDRWQTGDPRVGHDLRHEVRGHRHTREQIAPEPVPSPYRQRAGPGRRRGPPWPPPARAFGHEPAPRRPLSGSTAAQTPHTRSPTGRAARAVRSAAEDGQRL